MSDRDPERLRRLILRYGQMCYRYGHTGPVAAQAYDDVVIGTRRGRDELIESITAKDARIAELESQVTALCDAREHVAMMVPVGVDTGTVEQNVERYIGQLVHDVARWRDLAQVEADTLTQTERRIWAMVRERNEAREVLREVNEINASLRLERDVARRDAATAWTSNTIKINALTRLRQELDEARAAIRKLLLSADASWEEHRGGHDWPEACQDARAILDGGERGDHGDVMTEMREALSDAKRVVQPIIDAERAAANRHVGDIVLRDGQLLDSWFDMPDGRRARQDEIDTLTRERDEARAEVERLRGFASTIRYLIGDTVPRPSTEAATEAVAVLHEVLGVGPSFETRLDVLTRERDEAREMLQRLLVFGDAVLIGVVDDEKYRRWREVEREAHAILAHETVKDPS